MEGQRRMLRRIIERQAVLGMGVGGGQLSQEEVGGCERPVGLREEHGVVCLLR